MLPPPRANLKVSWIEVIVKTTIIFGLGWFLVSNMLAFNRGIEAIPELKAADRALQAKDIAGARAQFDKLLRSSHGGAAAYSGIILLCGANQQADLLETYGQQAKQACKSAPIAEKGELYRNLAGAELELGGKYREQALASAQTAYDLEPHNISSMNSLAYTIAEVSAEPARLRQAEDLIFRALNDLNSRTDVPDRPLLEPMFMDTYAWVLYKAGLYGPAAEAPARFARAAALLVDVVDRLPNGIAGSTAADLYYHLGAALNKTGQYSQARNALDIALHYNPANSAARRERDTLPADDTRLASPQSPANGGKASATDAGGAASAFTPVLPPHVNRQK